MALYFSPISALALDQSADRRFDRFCDLSSAPNNLPPALNALLGDAHLLGELLSAQKRVRPYGGTLKSAFGRSARGTFVY
jgi:hypothetical protein